MARRTRSTRYFGRYREILVVLMKYGFEDIVAHSPFRNLIPKWKRVVPKRQGRSVFQHTRYERMRCVCEELGPTFIKFGQLLSNRPDLIPEDLARELEKLQDHVPPFPQDQVEPLLEAELGKPPSELFHNLHLQPIASASIAQVHEAQLATGEHAVLKIQRPNIRAKIESDLNIMKDLAGIMERNFQEVTVMQPMELIQTFEKTIKKEMDFKTEASNIQKFKDDFKNEKELYVPVVYKDYSTRRILCMEYIDGIKVTDKEELTKRGFNLKEIADKGVDLYFKQIFDHGFFHADPHPANFFIMPDKRVCMLDFGMMGHVMPADQDILGDLLYYTTRQDIKKIAYTVQRLARSSEIDESNEFEYEIKEFLDEFMHVSIEEIEISEVIRKLRRLLYQYKIIIPRNYHLLLRALGIVEGVGLHLNPQFNIVENLRPYAKQIISRKYHPYRMALNMYNALQDFTLLGSDLPSDLRVIIDKLKKGTLHIEFEHRGLERLYNSLDIVSNRIAFSIVVAALIIGSSLIVLSGIPPIVYNIPLIGLIGFAVSGLLALWLLIAILRRGRF